MRVLGPQTHILFTLELNGHISFCSYYVFPPCILSPLFFYFYLFIYFIFFIFIYIFLHQFLYLTLSPPWLEAFFCIDVMCENYLIALYFWQKCYVWDVINCIALLAPNVKQYFSKSSLHQHVQSVHNEVKYNC